MTINGWSVHRIGSWSGDHFEVHVGDKFVIAAKNQATDKSQNRWVTVVLLRPGQPPDKLYDVNEDSRTVDQFEYERTFH